MFVKKSKIFTKNKGPGGVTDVRLLIPAITGSTRVGPCSRRTERADDEPGAAKTCDRSAVVHEEEDTVVYEVCGEWGVGLRGYRGFAFQEVSINLTILH